MEKKILITFHEDADPDMGQLVSDILHMIHDNGVKAGHFKINTDISDDWQGEISVEKEQE